MSQQDKITYSLISACAPVIKGLTIANTLTVKRGTYKYLLDELKSSPLSLHLLHINNTNEIILIYREEKLREHLLNDEVESYLSELGYDSDDVTDVLNKLSKRFTNFYVHNTLFPHELGIILNYPLEDIKGFIKNDGQNYLACRYWKVYSNLNEALNIFNEFDKALVTSLSQLVSGYKLNEIITSA